MMRRTARSLYVALLALLAAIALGVTTAFTSVVVVRAASIALIMGGTGNPVPNQEYLDNVSANYIWPNSAFCTDATCDSQPLETPEEFWPVYGGFSALTFDESVAQGVMNLEAKLGEFDLDPATKVVISGYSQSARIATIVKRKLAENPGNWDDTNLEFNVIGNPNRPNGGILSWFAGLYIPILDVTFDGATPTDTEFETTDFSFKWDIISDFPLYPLNLLAVLNGLAGYFYEHGTYPEDLPGGWTEDELAYLMTLPENRQHLGDTEYITVAPKELPLLHPLADLAALTGTSFLMNPILDLIRPTMTLLIEELGYNRNIPFGQPTAFQLVPLVNPISLAIGLVTSVIQGIGDALTPGAANDLDIPEDFAPTTSEPETASTFMATKAFEPQELPATLDAPTESRSSPPKTDPAPVDNSSTLEMTGKLATVEFDELDTPRPTVRGPAVVADPTPTGPGTSVNGTSTTTTTVDPTDASNETVTDGDAPPTDADSPAESQQAADAGTAAAEGAANAA